MKGLTREAAERALGRMGIVSQFSGSGTRVVSQHVQANRPEATLYTTDPGNQKIVGSRAGLIPDVRGTMVRQAVYELTAAGFRVEVSGSGRVASQRPPAGTQVKQGTTCQVICRKEG